MPSYAWSCLACAASNAPMQARCAQCGCPASADYAQVEAAKRTAHINENTRPRLGLVETLQSFRVLWIAAGVLALCVSSYRSPRPAST